MIFFYPILSFIFTEKRYLSECVYFTLLFINQQFPRLNNINLNTSFWFVQCQLVSIACAELGNALCKYFFNLLVFSTIFTSINKKLANYKMLVHFLILFYIYFIFYIQIDHDMEFLNYTIRRNIRDIAKCMNMTNFDSFFNNFHCLSRKYSFMLRKFLILAFDVFKVSN